MPRYKRMTMSSVTRATSRAITEISSYPPPPMAVQNLEHIPRKAPHRTLEMTLRYANLVTADLQAVHERVTLLKC